MARKNIEDIKLEDIDFEVVKACDDKHVVKRYIKLIEDDGNYFTDLLKACKEKLLEIAPKEYYLMYPRVATDQEVSDATQDLLDWEAAVTETDKALKSAKKDKIFDDVVGYKVNMPIRGQEPVYSRPNVQKEPGAKHLDQPRKEDAFARDKSNMKDYYKAWDKVDVDAMEEEMEREEREEEEARQRHFEELKEEQDAAQAFAPIKVADTEAVPEAHRRHMADSEKEKGNEAFYARDFEEAEAYYSRSLRYKADDPSTWANRALVRLKLDNAQGALEDCEHALAVNARYMKALHRKGKALFELGRYEDAVKTFQLALAESPGNTQINGDLMVARRKCRSAPGPSKPAPKSSPMTTSSCRIEELDPETEQPLDKAKPPALQPNYTRVMIEEDSDSDSEDDAGGGSAPSGTSKGFRKVQIEEVSGSEDEEEEEVSVQASPAVQPAADQSCGSATSDGSVCRPSTNSQADGGGFRKVQIVEESDSEEEGSQGASAAQGGPTAAPAVFAPPPRAPPEVRSPPPPAAEPAPLHVASAPVEASGACSFDGMD